MFFFFLLQYYFPFFPSVLTGNCCCTRLLLCTKQKTLLVFYIHWPRVCTTNASYMLQFSPKDGCNLPNYRNTHRTRQIILKKKTTAITKYYTRVWNVFCAMNLFVTEIDSRLRLTHNTTKLKHFYDRHFGSRAGAGAAVRRTRSTSRPRNLARTTAQNLDEIKI